MNTLDTLRMVLYFTNIGMILLIGAMFLVTPIIVRKSLLFGIRVPETVQSDPAVRALRKNYILTSAVIYAIFAAVVTLQYFFLPSLTFMVCIYIPLLLIAIQLLIYIPRWNRAKALKNSNRWQVADSVPVETRSSVEQARFSGLPWGWYIASAIICLGMIAFTYYKYPLLPEKIIIHWNASMKPNAWSQKNLWTVLTLPLIGFATVVLTLLCNIVIYKMKLQISTENPTLSFAQHRIYRKLLSHLIGWIALTTTLLMMFMQSLSISLFNVNTLLLWTVFILYMAAMIVPNILLNAMAGQSGCKLKPKAIPNAESVAPVEATHVYSTKGDDKYWKLGMFYYNPDDPSIFVENRFGTNSGLNYAKPVAKIGAVLLAVLLTAAYVWMTYLWFISPGLR